MAIIITTKKIITIKVTIIIIKVQISDIIIIKKKGEKIEEK